MNDAQRAILLALYAATVAALPLFDRHSPIFRALCQMRAEIERVCDLPQRPTRRNAA